MYSEKNKISKYISYRMPICFNTNIFLISYMIILSILFFIIYKFYCKTTKTRSKKEIINTSVTIPQQNNIPSNITISKPIETIPEIRYGMSDPVASSQVGFVYSEDSRFPLYENRRFRKYLYHLIDGSRNNIRISVKAPKDEQLFEGQEIFIPELNSIYTVKLYEINNYQYY